MGYKVDELHSNRTQNQRKRVMEGFRSGKFRILVATDIAARGIDVPNIEAVVNYDIPDQTEDYVHRIGRTGRAGNTGIAFTFAMRSQSRAIRDIEKFMGQRLNLRQLPSLPARRVDKESLRQFKADKRRRHEPKNKKKYGDRSRREDSRSESGSRNKKRKPFSKNGDAGQGKSDWNRPFKSRRNRSANTSGRPSFRGKNNQSGGGKNRRTRSVTTRRSSR